MASFQQSRPEAWRTASQRRAPAAAATSRRRVSSVLLLLSVMSILAWLGYLLYRERRTVQQLSEELRHDRESHVRDLVQHATDWRLMSSSSIAGFQKAERQAMAYGMETASITEAAATLPSPQSVPADATIQIRRAARGASSVEVEFQVLSSAGATITGLEYQSFHFESPDTAPLHYLVTSENSLSAEQVVAVVLDCSDSMQGEKLVSATRAAKELVSNLPTAARVGLLTFGNDVQRMTPWTTDREVLREALGQLQTSGRTALFRALDVATSELGRRTGRRHLILCTDGKDTVGGISEAEVIRRCQADGITLHTVGIEGGDVDLELLQRLSQTTNGKAQTAENPVAIIQQLTRLTAELSEPVYRGIVLDPERRLTELRLQVGGDGGPEAAITISDSLP
ncbi:MAG: vWA domain-containing protein [Planctomyces sp.]